MRMSFKGEVAPPSRIERIRCGVQSRTADAAQVVADRARPLAGDAANAAQHAAQSAAASVSDAANVAAHSVAEAAATAAQSVAERARPLANEAATRGAAAWTILRYGAPAPSPMTRIAALLPTTAVAKAGSTVKSKGNSAVALMAVGGVAAAAVMWWRKSRVGTDSVWILDEDDSDVEPPDGWHEGSSPMPVTSAKPSEQANGQAADFADSEPSRKRSNTWP